MSAAGHEVDQWNRADIAAECYCGAVGVSRQAATPSSALMTHLMHAGPALMRRMQGQMLLTCPRSRSTHGMHAVVTSHAHCAQS